MTLPLQSTSVEAFIYFTDERSSENTRVFAKGRKLKYD
jgi:hypothetical protein